MSSLTKVVVDDLYENIHSFVSTNEISVDDYDSMIEVVLRMIKEGYCFTMDRDILRDAMECLTYMYSPSDDMNKDRVVQQLCDGGDDSDDEDDEVSDMKQEEEVEQEDDGEELSKQSSVATPKKQVKKARKVKVKTSPSKN